MVFFFFAFSRRPTTIECVWRWSSSVVYVLSKDVMWNIARKFATIWSSQKNLKIAKKAFAKIAIPWVLDVNKFHFQFVYTKLRTYSHCLKRHDICHNPFAINLVSKQHHHMISLRLDIYFPEIPRNKDLFLLSIHAYYSYKSMFCTKTSCNAHNTWL